MEIDRKAALKTEIHVKEEINEADYKLKSSKTSKNQTIIIRKWVDISISANEPLSEGLSIEFPISQELSKKRTQFFIWNANTKVWEPIGKPMVHKSTNEDGNYFIDLDVTKSGSYSLGEIAPVSKIKATVKAPKDKALLSCNYISTEPFINIPAVIDEKQSSTTVEIPKEYSNGIIQCIVSDVNGNIETIDCQIAKTFKAKMHQFLHPKELKITTK